MLARLKKKFRKAPPGQPTAAATNASTDKTTDATTDPTTDPNAEVEGDNPTSLMKRPASALADRVSIMILDEGHKAKETDSLNYLSVDKARAIKHIIVSATPISNRVQDLGAFLHMCVPISVLSDASWVQPDTEVSNLVSNYYDTLEKGDTRALHPT